MEEKIKKGGISVETQNIFPVIKKWLYSEKDIFLREIVSNATDAITKLKRLQSLGKIPSTDEEYRIDVIVDKDEKTITVKDNGIGMSEEELSKYICQIALSGALDFIQKYEGSEGAGDGIIGHFGLGFYSAFMVSSSVEIISKSYTEAPAVHWTCSDIGEYELEGYGDIPRGTTVIMHVSSSEEEYLDANKLRGMLDKYCSFMPVEIYFSEAGAKEEPMLVNETIPLWLRPASECKPEEYNEFYKKVFRDFKDPLFYIHINADYPLNFKGILFFPAINTDYESIEGQVKLYYNQVFVSDNIKEVIPEYMFMLKGVLDCPELPLNVSRSYLQTNTYVSRLSAHIVKKVSDKLNALYNTERETYEKVWDDIKIFVEYACMRDKKFYDRVKDALLMKLTDGSYVTVKEYLEVARETNENTVYYTSDKALQAQYITLLEEQGIKVACFDKQFEVQFLSLLEQNMEGVKFVRVDADIASALMDGTAAEDLAPLTSLFVEVSGNAELKTRVERLKSTRTPAILTVSEESRRFEEMMQMYSGSMGMPTGTGKDETLIINASSDLIARVTSLLEFDRDRAALMASYIYKLALLSQRRLSAEEMSSFLEDGFAILERL